jgi:Ser/Thr protein kinase RdoA (MazF antagonist)
MTHQETPLLGGLVNRAMRVGDTVRRPAGPWTPAVQALLAHLAEKGFPAPRPLGIDQQGREIVGYLEGRTSIWPWPEALLEEGGVREVGRLIRRLHDAVSDFRPSAPQRWQRGERAVLAGEIVCHGDLDASNVVWARGEPIGIIDWESAYPGWAITDVANAAWSLCPLTDDEDVERMGFRSPPSRALRLRALLAGYGSVEPITVLTEVHRLELEREALVEELGAAGVEPWRTYREKRLGDRAGAARRWLAEHFRALSANR